MNARSALQERVVAVLDDVNLKPSERIVAATVIELLLDIRDLLSRKES